MTESARVIQLLLDVSYCVETVGNRWIWATSMASVEATRHKIQVNQISTGWIPGKTYQFTCLRVDDVLPFSHNVHLIPIPACLVSILSI